MKNNNSKFGYDISIVTYNNEKWVRVQAMDEDFIIAPHDLTDAEGKVMKNRAQPELMERLEELGLATFNRKQGFIITTLIEEINAKLEEAGGDEFDEDWYASKEFMHLAGSAADSIWFLNGTLGYFSFSFKYFDYFRSRPVLEYDEKGGEE